MPESPLQVLFIGHEASRTGAPVGFLSLMQWFRQQQVAEPLIWLRHGGPLVDAHAAVGPLAIGAEGSWPPATNQSVHLAYLNTATLGGFARLLAAQGIPVICHVHEMEFGLRYTGEHNLDLLRQHVTRFIACSYAVKSALIRVLGIEESKIDVVPECVDVGRALRMAQETPTGAMPQTPDRVIAGMGTVNWRKGVDLFLRVLAHLNRSGQTWHGVWIGDLETSPDREQLLHDIRVLGVEDRVHFTGSLANPFPHLAQADVYCLTSREDPYPLAMVEAAALGKPIVGFRGSGGVEEFAAEAGGICVDYADTAAMAEAVLACCSNGPQRGREAAEKLCVPDVVGSAIAGILHATAQPQPTQLDAQVITQLQQASMPAAQAEVLLVSADDERRELKTCASKVNVDGKIVVTESWPEENGVLTSSIVVLIEPQVRSVVVQHLQVQLRSQKDREIQSQPPFKVRTGGPAMRCGHTSPKSWLCLDGKGRLLVELQLPAELSAQPSVEITLSWHQNIHVKEALGPLMQRKNAAAEGGPSWWRRITGNS